MPRVSTAAVFVMAVLGLCASACSRSNGGTATGPTPSSVADLRGANIATHAQPKVPSSDSWSRLRVGLKVYTGDDGGDTTTLTVCPTVTQYIDWANSVDSGPSCAHEKRGLPATVAAIVRAKPDDPVGAPYVRLRSTDGSWTGYTGVVSLRPALPVGGVLVIKKGGSDKLDLAARQSSDFNTGLDLGKSAEVKILHYYPDTGDRSLYVTVLDGDHAGKNGWMFSLSEETQDGANLDGLRYDLTTPGPTTDPMKRTYTLTGGLRVFSDIQTCKDSFNAMHDDDAYKRLKDAVASGQYHDFSKGDALHITSDPDPSELWVIVSDDNGNQGCASRYNLPGY